MRVELSVPRRAGSRGRRAEQGDSSPGLGPLEELSGSQGCSSKLATLGASGQWKSSDVSPGVLCSWGGMLGSPPPLCCHGKAVPRGVAWVSGHLHHVLLHLLGWDGTDVCLALPPRSTMGSRTATSPATGSSLGQRVSVLHRTGGGREVSRGQNGGVGGRGRLECREGEGAMGQQ